MQRDSSASAAPVAAPELAADPLPTEPGDSPLGQSADAGLASTAVAPSVQADAALAQALDCQTGCECERRGDRDFMFCATPVTFADAALGCAAAGGTLASVDDAEQNDWLTRQMVDRDADDFWLSGTDAADEGVWRWADGRVFYPIPDDAGAAFVPWDDQQPNDLNGEDCMRSVGGVWRDLSCELTLGYVCQG